MTREDPEKTAAKINSMKQLTPSVKKLELICNPKQNLLSLNCPQETQERSPNLLSIWQIVKPLICWTSKMSASALPIILKKINYKTINRHLHIYL